MNNDKFIIDDNLLQRIGVVLEETGHLDLLNETQSLDMVETEVTEQHISDDGKTKCVHYKDGGIIVEPTEKEAK